MMFLLLLQSFKYFFLLIFFFHSSIQLSFFFLYFFFSSHAHDVYNSKPKVNFFLFQLYVQPSYYMASVPLNALLVAFGRFDGVLPLSGSGSFSPTCFSFCCPSGTGMEIFS